MDKNKSRGFTLVELLTVIAIIVFLSAVILASLASAGTKGRDAKRISELQGVAAALEMYYQDNNTYPTASCTSDPSTTCWAQLLPTTYITIMPQDPSFIDNGTSAGNQSLMYSYYSDGQNFILAARLENPVSSTSNHYYTGNYGSTGYANWAIKNGLQ